MYEELEYTEHWDDQVVGHTFTKMMRTNIGGEEEEISSGMNLTPLQ